MKELPIEPDVEPLWDRSSDLVNLPAGTMEDSESSAPHPGTDRRTSEIRYRRLFEAARDGILLLNPTSRKITDANPFMTELLGYAREELLGKELWEIGLLKDEKASQAAFGN